MVDYELRIQAATMAANSEQRVHHVQVVQPGVESLAKTQLARSEQTMTNVA